MALIALCFAAAGSRVSLTGGLYAYIEVAFGGFAAFIGGISVLGRRHVCRSRRLRRRLPVRSACSGRRWARGCRGRSCSSCCSPLSRSSTSAASSLESGSSKASRRRSSCRCCLLVGAGVWSLNPDFLAMPMPTVSQVGQVSIVLLFAFVGVEVALTPSGEIRDPSTRCRARSSRRLPSPRSSISPFKSSRRGCSVRSCRHSRMRRWPRRPGGARRGRADAPARWRHRVDLRVRGGRHAGHAARAACAGARRRAATRARDGASAIPHTRVGDRRLRGGRRGARDFEQLRTARGDGQRVGAAAVPVLCGGVLRAAAARREDGRHTVYASRRRRSSSCSPPPASSGSCRRRPAPSGRPRPSSSLLRACITSSNCRLCGRLPPSRLRRRLRARDR